MIAGIIAAIEENRPQLDPAEHVRVSERIRTLLAEAPAPANDAERNQLALRVRRQIENELNVKQDSEARADARAADQAAEQERNILRLRQELSAYEAAGRLLVSDEAPPTDHRER